MRLYSTRISDFAILIFILLPRTCDPLFLRVSRDIFSGHDVAIVYRFSMNLVNLPCPSAMDARDLHCPLEI